MRFTPLGPSRAVSSSAPTERPTLHTSYLSDFWVRYLELQLTDPSSSPNTQADAHALKQFLGCLTHLHFFLSWECHCPIAR